MSEPFYYGPFDIEKIQNDIEELKEGNGGNGLPEYFPPMIYDFHIYSEDSDEWVEITEDAENTPLRTVLYNGALDGQTTISLPDTYTKLKIEFSNTNAYTAEMGGEAPTPAKITSPVIVEDFSSYAILLSDIPLTSEIMADYENYNISVIGILIQSSNVGN